MKEIQRRNFPRYEQNIDVLIHSKELTSKTINISKYGLCLETKESFNISEKIELEMLLSNKKIQHKGRIIWKNFEKNLYGIDFSEYKENIPVEWEEYIDSIKDNEIERRNKKERRTNINGKKENNRKLDRRLNYPIFSKIKTFNKYKNLEKMNAFSYLRRVDSSSEHLITVKNKKMINMGSNNYLGMTTHPEVVEAAIKATEKYGVGSGSVRVLSGTIDIHNELERKLVEFKGGDECLIYSTGYTANIAILSCLLNSHDLVLIDEKSHASLIDGCVLAQVPILPFRHNNMIDLERKLSKNKNKSTLIITDGVFSMDGDISPIDKIYEIGKTYNTPVLIDDAHGTGVTGKGRGTVAHFELEGKIALNVGTLSKALGGLGGFVIANKEIIYALKHFSRGFIFTASLPPSMAAAMIKVIEVLQKDDTILNQLNKNIEFIKKELTKLNFNIGNSQSAVIPLIVEDDLTAHKIALELEEYNIFVNAIAYPAVKHREARLRLSIMATHSQDELEYFIAKLKIITDKYNFKRV